MTPLDQLFWLVVLHFIFDFQLQSDFIARNKSPGSGHVWPWVLSAHAAGHGTGAACAGHGAIISWDRAGTRSGVIIWHVI